MNKTVLVTVAASTGGGKSTITSIIKKTLEDAGVDVQYNPVIFDELPDDVVTQVRLNTLKEQGLAVELLEQQMNRRSSEDNGAAARIDNFFNSERAMHSYFGYVEDWVKIPLEDARDYFWYVDEDSGFVRFAEEKENLEDLEVGDYYEREIYTQRFLPKYVYRTDDYTMISVDTHTDGNKFLQIFDNAKQCQELLCET